jgi:hypothetical protein
MARGQRCAVGWQLAELRSRLIQAVQAAPISRYFMPYCMSPRRRGCFMGFRCAPRITYPMSRLGDFAGVALAGFTCIYEVVGRSGIS